MIAGNLSLLKIIEEMLANMSIRDIIPKKIIAGSETSIFIIDSTIVDLEPYNRHYLKR